MSNQIAPINLDKVPEISDRAVAIATSLPGRDINLETSMVVSGQSKFVSVELPKNKWDRVELLHFTDLQYGNSQCNEKKIIEYRNWVLAEPNRLALFGGDMCDYNTMLSVGKGAMEQRFDPDEQVLSLAEILAPISHRVIGYVGGNHENRGQKIGHDFGAHLASLLRIPYSAGIQHIDLYFGKWKPFKIYLWHGRGGARTMGAKAQIMGTVVSHDRANLYISGHTHSALVIPGSHIERDHKAKQVRMEKYYCVSSTSFMNYYGTYAESAYYAPNFLLMGAAIVYPNRTFRISI